MFEHLIFFDDRCALCRRSVLGLIEEDKEKRFIFAPFQSEIAESILVGPQKRLSEANSLILVEHYQSTERRFWIRMAAIGRIYAYFKGWKKLLGIFSHLPPSWVDFLYRTMAEHRHQFPMEYPEKLGPKERFLP